MIQLALAPLSTYSIPTRTVDEEGFFQIPLLRNLARRLGKDITIYDLESTTLLDQPTFGITEVAMLTIPHDGGPLVMRADLVNPENPIDPVVIGLNGITQEMVDEQPNFMAWISRFKIAAEETLAFGYNSTNFDGPGVRRESARYGSEIVFGDTIDLRARYVDLMRKTGNGRKGKLAEVLAIFGIVIEGEWHRAGFDVIATALVAEAILEHYGITGLLERPLHAIPNPTDNVNNVKAELTPQMKAVYEAVNASGYDARKIARDLGMTINAVCDAAWDLFHGGSLRIEQITEARIQEFLKPHIKACAERAWGSEETYGRLKPVLGEIRCLDKAPYVDYTQLKVALTYAGLR